jgi:hypothetical protein
VVQNGRVIDTAFHPSYQNPIPRPFGAVLHGFPRPQIRTIEPSMAPERRTDLTITIHGKGFVRPSIVYFGASRVPTEFVGSTELRAHVPGRLLTAVGTSYVLVKNPQPVEMEDPLHEDDRSNPVSFMVTFGDS